jgi:diaminopropionate ammonia-lyase
MIITAVHKNTLQLRRDTYPFEDVLSLAGAARAHAEIAACPQYRCTPLFPLRGLARHSGIGRISYKDESARFGIGSFKALGGAYAVARVLSGHLHRSLDCEVSSADLARGRYREHTARLTVCCATDGNHGRAVAAGAQIFGCRCVIFLHAGVSLQRERAIAAFGAEIVRVAGTYDDSVRAARQAADTNCWIVVADTSWPGYEATPALIMQGYATMIIEILAQLRNERASMPTHAFVQAGVGGLAAAVIASLWQELGEQAPKIVVVEPHRAACLFASAVAGQPAPVQGALDTVMAGLACGEVSELAWRIVAAGADYFVTLHDQGAIDSMRLLASGEFGDPPIVAGESATAGLAALLAMSRDEELRRQIGLDANSHVLVFGTEGATDPELYHQLVGRTAACVSPEGG